MAMLQQLCKRLVSFILAIGLIVLSAAPSQAAITVVAGGPGGNDFSDEPLVSADQSVAEVVIHSGNLIDSVAVVVTDPAGDRSALPTHGGSGGNEARISLAPGEAVIGISGRHGDVLDSLTLQTTAQSYGPYGGSGGGQEYSLQIPEGTEFIGFAGRSGQLVDALALAYRDLPEPLLCESGALVTYPANGHQYCLSPADQWTEAQDFATSLGGYLVTVNDQAEQDWLLETFGAERLYWIGYTDQDLEGSFVWASGQTPVYTHWLPGEPNNGNCYADEHYAAMNWFNAQGQWNDLSNSGYYEDCSDVSQFCGEEGQLKPAPADTCIVGFKPLMGIVEIEPSGSLQGLKWNDLNGNGERDNQLIKGENPNALFVVDVSRSSIMETFEGSSVGDVNGTGQQDTILDAELAGFIALNQQLIQSGFGDSAQVGIVVFGSDSQQVDMDPASPDRQLITTAGADADGDGVLDVEEALTSIQAFNPTNVPPYQVKVGGQSTKTGPGTNFEAALQATEATLQAIDGDPDQSNIIFLSDGVPSPSIPQYYGDEIERITGSGVNLVAFGVGEGASLTALQALDADAQIFTTTDELLSVFKGVESPTGSASGSGPRLEPLLPDTVVYLDLNRNGMLDEDEPRQPTDAAGAYQFQDLFPGTYGVREVIPEGYQQTFPTGGVHTITLGAGEQITGLNFGNVQN